MSPLESKINRHGNDLIQHIPLKQNDIENGECSAFSISTTPTKAASPLESECWDTNINNDKQTSRQPHHTNTDAGKLVFAIVGIYGAYLHYGSVQEDIFRYETSEGKRFRYAWFLQVFEALTNVIIGCTGRYVTGQCTSGLSLKYFYMSGTSQVLSKGLTSLSLASGLSFPVATLAKSGKMAPVMMGQLILGGTRYSLRDYAQVATIIFGTILLSLGKKKPEDNNLAAASSTFLGVIFILLSLFMDGVTAGLQKRVKVKMEIVGKTPTPYDFMFYTNISMMLVALLISFVTQENFFEGWFFVQQEPALRVLIVHFCICSAIGQSFVYYTVAHFDPLICTTITTTRKIVSVLWSISTKGHVLMYQGWIGVGVAILGLIAEVHSKFLSHNKNALNNRVNM